MIQALPRAALFRILIPPIPTSPPFSSSSVGPTKGGAPGRERLQGPRLRPPDQSTARAASEPIRSGSGRSRPAPLRAPSCFIGCVPGPANERCHRRLGPELVCARCLPGRDPGIGRCNVLMAAGSAGRRARENYKCFIQQSSMEVFVETGQSWWVKALLPTPTAGSFPARTRLVIQSMAV